jgi:hypothetical protein
MASALVRIGRVPDAIIHYEAFLPEGEPGADPAAPVYRDARGVRMAKGSWNVRYRVAAAPGWGIAFHVIWDKTIVSRNQLLAVCIDASRYVGIGDGRKIGFGRFEVTKFEATDAANETLGRSGIRCGT